MKEKKTIRMQMEMSGKHDKSIKPHTHTQMRCLLVVLIYNIHALYLHQSLLCNNMQHASREEEVRTWRTFFFILYKQGTKNAIVSTQTLAYTYPCIFSKQFHISCILAFPMAGQWMDIIAYIRTSNTLNKFRIFFFLCIFLIVVIFSPKIYKVIIIVMIVHYNHNFVKSIVLK